MTTTTETQGSNLQPVEMRSWLYGCTVSSYSFTVLSVTFTDTTCHTKDVNFFFYTNKATLHYYSWRRILLFTSHLFPGPHLYSMLLIKFIWAQEDVTAVHIQSLKKLEEPFHKTRIDVQVSLLPSFHTLLSLGLSNGGRLSLVTMMSRPS